ncbi:hypothetical protein [Planctobacterium marinum]|uniref:Uncharacterized protein n=1 Tax=Planctobacterium marinum TaxID=1631968 RepID=A0AA48I4N8_9ALTE|nr:hypothetical protein MACH26_13860 [Planctobacterium marinum]
MEHQEQTSAFKTLFSLAFTVAILVSAKTHAITNEVESPIVEQQLHFICDESTETCAITLAQTEILACRTMQPDVALLMQENTNQFAPGKSTQQSVNKSNIAQRQFPLCQSQA